MAVTTIFPVTILSAATLASLTSGDITALGNEQTFELPGGRGDGGWLMLDAEGTFTFASAPAANATLSLYCVSALDTDYVTTPTIAKISSYEVLKIGDFIVAGVGTPFLERIPLTPSNGNGVYAYMRAAKKYKFCLVNNTAVDLAPTGNIVIATPILPYNRNLA